MFKNVNTEIAITHVVTRKKQTLVAALGVCIGVGIYLFMNSLSSGFSQFSRDEIFKNSAHIKIYKDDELSEPIGANANSSIKVITNPQITTLSNKIINPAQLLATVKTQPYVTSAIAHVTVDVFYNRGKAQLRGTGNGVNMKEYSKMFSTAKYMVAGSVDDLEGNLNGIIVGSGIATKLNLGLGENITVTSSYNVVKVLRIVGVFKTGSSLIDNSKCYFNVSVAQQLLKEGPAYVSTILVNTPNVDQSAIYMERLQRITDYKVEDWKTTNADLVSGDKTRSALMGAISLSILLVASFGIYNILSATVSQKIDDIAILKATGFSGGDVIRIFVLEALIMGVIGTIIGLLFGAMLIVIMSKVYMGGPVGYFPIAFEPRLFATSFLLGIFITICAGFFPARKASRVDPVEIFRK